MRSGISAGIALLLIGTTLLLSPTAARAQDMQQILLGIIQQLQVGRPNPDWYGFQLWETIHMQTRNTGGVYPQLVQLGRATNAVVEQQIPMPQGMLYSMRATHEHGTSIWNLGYDRIRNRIEYADFNIGPQSMPLPSASQPATPTAPRGQDQPADRASEACRRFPSLC